MGLIGCSKEKSNAGDPVVEKNKTETVLDDSLSFDLNNQPIVLQEVCF